jgi:hypothetical protein
VNEANGFINWPASRAARFISATLKEPVPQLGDFTPPAARAFSIHEIRLTFRQRKILEDQGVCVTGISLTHLLVTCTRLCLDVVVSNYLANAHGLRSQLDWPMGRVAADAPAVQPLGGRAGCELGRASRTSSRISHSVHDVYTVPTVLNPTADQK